MYSVELHEEAQAPQVICLIIIHGTTPHDVLLRGVASGCGEPSPHMPYVYVRTFTTFMSGL